MNTNRLGRGVNALFQNENVAAGKNPDMRFVPISAIRPNPYQPRQDFDPDALRELADSIKKQGIIQPLLVRSVGENIWQIVAGERRWRAAEKVGLTEVPVFVRDVDDREIMAVALIENLQREDLNPIEEALALEKLRNMLHLSQEDIADRLGKSRPAVANALRLLKLSPEAQTDLRSGAISAGHARCLLGINDPTAAATLHQQVRETNLTVRKTEEAAGEWRNSGKFPWTEASAQGSAVPRQGRRKKSPELRELQNSLNDTLACRISISGDINSGRISLSYESKEVLNTLLERLGVAQNPE